MFRSDLKSEILHLTVSCITITVYFITIFLNDLYFCYHETSLFSYSFYLIIILVSYTCGAIIC